MLLSINSSVQSIGLAISLLALVGLAYWIYQIWVKEIKQPNLSFDQVMATKGPTLFKAIGALSTIAEVIGLAIIGMMHPEYPMNPFSAVARYGSLGLMEASANFFFQAVVAARITRYVADGKFTWLEKLKSVVVSLPWFIVACMATHLIAILYTESTNAFHIAFSGSIGTPWNMFKIVVTDPTGMVGLVRLDASALIMIYISQFIDILMVLVMFRVPKEEWERQAQAAKAAGILPTAAAASTPAATPSTPSTPSTPPASSVPPAAGPSVPPSVPPASTPPPPTGSGTPPSSTPPRTTSPDLAVASNPLLAAFVPVLERLFLEVYSPSVVSPTGERMSITFNNTPASPKHIIDMLFTACGLTGYSCTVDPSGRISLDCDNLSVSSDLTKADPRVKAYLDKLLNNVRASMGSVSNTMLSSQSLIDAAFNVTASPNEMSPVKMAEEFITKLYNPNQNSTSLTAFTSDFANISLNEVALKIVRSAAKSSIMAEISTIASNIRSKAMFGFISSSSQYDVDVFNLIDADSLFQQLPDELQSFVKYHTASIFHLKGNPLMKTRAVDEIRGMILMILETAIPNAVANIEGSGRSLDEMYTNLLVIAKSSMMVLQNRYPSI